MEVVVLLCMLVVIVGVLVGVLSLARQEWKGVWRGHEIVVRNHLTREELFIDGRLVSHTASEMKLGAAMTGTIHDGGREVPVAIAINQGTLGLTIDAQVFVDGEALALERGKIGSFQSSSPPPESTAPRQPTDLRWRAVVRLLSEIRQHSPPEIDEVCDGVEAQLRALLLEIEHITVSLEAHRLLDQDHEQPSGESGIQAIRDIREEQVRALFSAIQQLHIAAWSATDDAELQELIMRMNTEVELAQAPVDADALKRRAAQANRTRER